MRRIVTAFVLFTLAVSLGAQPVVEPVPQEQFLIESKILGETRTILVRPPLSYRAGDRRYPTLYLTDGGRHLGHTAATTEFLAQQGRMPEVLVVAVVNTDRNRDLTPTKDASRPGISAGGADKFLDFFEKELIPAVDARYRTQSFRVFGGHSLGGLFALHAFFTRPNLFNAWIAVSPSLQWDNRYLLRRAGEFLDKAGKTFPATIVVTIGDEGEAPRTNFDEFKALLTRRAPRSFDVQFLHFADEDHDSVVMASHYAALRKVFAPWHFAIDEAADPKRELPRATEHYAKLSARAGYEIRVPEAVVNTLGYRLLQANRSDDAIPVFQTNVQNWPTSPNVYDSLGEAYEKAGKRAEARASYEKAVKFGAETNDPNLPIFRQNAERVK